MEARLTFAGCNHVSLQARRSEDLLGRCCLSPFYVAIPHGEHGVRCSQSNGREACISSVSKTWNVEFKQPLSLAVQQSPWLALFVFRDSYLFSVSWEYVESLVSLSGCN